MNESTSLTLITKPVINQTKQSEQLTAKESQMFRWATS